MSESLIDTLRQRQKSLKALAEPLPELIRMRLAVPLSASESDQVRRQLSLAEERQRQLQQQMAALQQQVDEWRKAYLDSQNEIARLNGALEAAQAAPVTTDLADILSLEPDEEADQAPLAIREALAAIPDLPDAPAPASQDVIWVLAPQGPDEWADELAGYLDDFGVGLGWARTPEELPQPFQERGLMVLTDDPGPFEALLEGIPNSLTLPPTHLMRAKIALLDNFIRGGR